LSEERALDAALFVATPRSIDKVLVAGRSIVVDGVHLRYDTARRGFERALSDMAFEASL
jgi:cytosine/adenosine deaminase-related metal-dependent hydrolase